MVIVNSLPVSTGSLYIVFLTPYHGKLVQILQIHTGSKGKAHYHNVRQSPDTLADIENNGTQCMHCATCAKTLVINVMGHQASSRKWMLKNSYKVMRQWSTRMRLALGHGGVSVPSSKPVFTVFCKQRRRMLKFQKISSPSLFYIACGLVQCC